LDAGGRAAELRYDSADPEDFPLAVHQRIPEYLTYYAAAFGENHYRWVFAHVPGHPAATAEDYHRTIHAAGGMNAARYRFAAMAHYDERFAALYADDSRRNARSRALFGFLVNGISSLECACSAAYAIGSTLANSSFPMDDESLKFDVGSIGAALQQEFGGSVGSFILRTVGCPEYMEWHRLRILYFHRMEPPLQYYVGGNRHGTADIRLSGIPHVNKFSFLNRPLEPALTRELRAWLSQWHGDFWPLVENMCQTYAMRL